MNFSSNGQAYSHVYKSGTICRSPHLKIRRNFSFPLPVQIRHGLFRYKSGAIFHSPFIYKYSQVCCSLQPYPFINAAQFVISPDLQIYQSHLIYKYGKVCHSPTNLVPLSQIWHGLFPAIRLYLEHYPTDSSQSCHSCLPYTAFTVSDSE